MTQPPVFTGARFKIASPSSEARHHQEPHQLHHQEFAIGEHPLLALQPRRTAQFGRRFQERDAEESSIFAHVQNVRGERSFGSQLGLCDVPVRVGLIVHRPAPEYFNPRSGPNAPVFDPGQTPQNHVLNGTRGPGLNATHKLGAHDGSR